MLVLEELLWVEGRAASGCPLVHFVDELGFTDDIRLFSSLQLVRRRLDHLVVKEVRRLRFPFMSESHLLQHVFCIVALRLDAGIIDLLATLHREIDEILDALIVILIEVGLVEHLGRLRQHLDVSGVD